MLTPRTTPAPTPDQQLDKHMHKMMWEKHERLEAIRADEAALAKLEEVIASHITPNLVRRAAAAAACQNMTPALACLVQTSLCTRSCSPAARH